MIDRKSRYVVVRHVPHIDAEHVAKATIEALRPHRSVTKTMTNDNGVEFQRDELLQKALCIPIFFTQPASPWQRESIENANGLVRQYVPRGASLDDVPPWTARALEETLNFRPREVLGYRTPHEIFYNEELRLMAYPLLRFGLEISSQV